MDVSRKVMAISMEDGLRIVGQVKCADVDALPGFSAHGPMRRHRV